MGTSDLSSELCERRITHAGIIESVFRHGDCVGAAMPFAHQPSARLQAETRIRGDSAVVRNIFASVFSLRRVALPSPPC